jgi:type IV fimbrial biogenesis protein FimT
MAVLAMISVIIVTASPTFVRLMRDRRVNRAGMQLVDYLRTARTRAIGHGQPILVRWWSQGFLPSGSDPTAGTGGIEIDEPIVTTSGASTNCNTTAWFGPTTQKMASFDIQNREYSYTAITFYDDTGTSGAAGSGAVPNYAEICFSSTGRMYIREGAGGVAAGAFRQVVGVPSFAVFNLQNNPSQAISYITTRWVLVPPNGDARMAL